MSRAQLSITSRRLVGYTILCSSLIALVATGLQFYADYAFEVTSIEGRLDLVEESYAASLSHGLWVADEELLRVQLDGVMQLPGVAWVTVQGAGDPIELGSRPHGRVRSHAFDLTYTHRGRPVHLGTVEVVADLDPVVARLTSRLLIVLATNTGKTLIVALFMLFIVRRLVTRHLDALAGQVQRIDAGDLTQPLRLERRALPAPDELQRVADALNRMSENLRQQRAENEALSAAQAQRVRDLEEFSYSLAHDLSTPVRTIQAFAELVEENADTSADAEGRRFARRIQAACERMSRLIQAMLNLSVVDHGELTVEPVDLAAMARDIVDERSAAEPDRKVTLSAPPTLPAQADPALIRTLLENLIGNAWRFTASCAVAHIEVGVAQVDDGPAWFVRDDGVGFEPELAARIFRPFQRAHADEHYAGNGVGLSIVRRVAERHGGRAWAEGEVGRGATMWFTLRP